MLRIPNQKGQSLLELLVALSILVVALTATIVLIVTSINAGREARNKLVATSLAREGIEIVRNIRDSNWIDTTDPSWDDGLIGDNTAIPVIDGVNSITLDFSENNFTPIKLDGNAYLQGSTAPGTDTQFYRLLYLNPICYDDSDPVNEGIVPKETDNDCATEFGANYSKVGVRVISEVRWPTADSNKKVIIEDRLYDWQVL